MFKPQEWLESFKRQEWLREPISSYTLALTIAIAFFIVLEPFYPVVVKSIPILKDMEFFPKSSEVFVGNFIEWFGVLYGFLLPLIMVRAWEQFDSIDREFDREADTIKILFEDIQLFRKEEIVLKTNILGSLHSYVSHVIENYAKEAETDSLERGKGDSLLKEIRTEYYDLIQSGVIERKEGEILTTEILHQLNEAIDVRGDRISLSNQRLFESLRIVSLLASIIFAIPFYFVEFHQEAFGFLDSILAFSVVFMIIFILTTIEELDDPFTGNLRININPWINLRNEIAESLREMGILPNAEREREQVISGGNETVLPSQ